MLNKKIFFTTHKIFEQIPYNSNSDVILIDSKKIISWDWMIVYNFKSSFDSINSYDIKLFCNHVNNYSKKVDNHYLISDNQQLCSTLAFYLAEKWECNVYKITGVNRVNYLRYMKKKNENFPGKNNLVSYCKIDPDVYKSKDNRVWDLLMKHGILK